jgi:hypothetical protein
MLSSSFADVIISTGSSMAAVSSALKRQWRAQSICVMKPGITRLHDFDLCIVPRHDAVRPRNNIVFIDGACTGVDPEYLKSNAEALRQVLTKKGKAAPLIERTIGVLIGGDTKQEILTAGRTRSVAESLARAVRDRDYQVLITTSRRTPADSEAVLKNVFLSDSRCPLLLIARNENYPCAVGGILGLSTVVIVSGESISMVSEAVASNKHVIVFRLEPRAAGRVSPRHERFLEHLVHSGAIHIAEPATLGATVQRLMDEPLTNRGSTDRQRIFEALKKIV